MSVNQTEHAMRKLSRRGGPVSELRLVRRSEVATVNIPFERCTEFK